MNTDMQFTLYRYAEYTQHNIVLNLNQIEHFLWLNIPADVACRCHLFQIDEIIPKQREVVYDECVTRERRTPWLKIKSILFNLDSGFHAYKFSFIDKETNDIIALYFAYTVQNDNPAKPYIYMKGNREPVAPPKEDGSRYERKL